MYCSSGDFHFYHDDIYISSFTQVWILGSFYKTD